MNLRWAIVVLALLVGCDSSSDPVERHGSKTPEEVYRRFMIANLSGDESTIRPLILHHDDAGVLWQGAYPPEVATALADQYQTMDITRVENSGSDVENKVTLQSSASPMPLTLVHVDGVWKVDAEPIIEFRKTAQKLQNEP